MRRYGWENVRGHGWRRWDMKNPPKELRTTNKCDLCGGSPVCVDFCFYRCLKFVELSDEDYQKRVKKI